MKKILFIFTLSVILSCDSRKKNSIDYSLYTTSYNLTGSSDLIYDKPYHVLGDTLFSFDIYQNKITKTPLSGHEAQEINLSFDFDSQPYTFYYINSDSIVFSTGNMLLLTDGRGSQFHSVKLFDNLGDIDNEVYSEFPFDGFSSHLVYDNHSNSVLFYFAKKSQTERRKVFASIDLENGDWASLPVYHPAEYQDVPLNYTTYPSVTWSPLGLSYIYTISPTIIHIDTVSGSQSEFNISSFGGKQSAEPQSYRDEWTSDYFENWVLTSPNYVKLIYDPFRKLYYRFSQAAMNIFPNRDEYYHDFLIKNRELYLTVLDEEFNVIVNQLIPKGKYDPSRSFVFSKGLWVPHEISIVQDEEQLYGDLFYFTDQ
ncbi:DUF4221 family protein [Algoriphagus halophytocola]|uniref:DUF4221 family protein n=1 Tax=Algoriphagus halophytocola TaxID=2991499 RepID=UPI0022DDF953|nr:DUF4221 family protein [Algoriphagus sp. TR-M9]WBL43447.1 DUF4221 family protein [Algoriphagus sp. TR-M9]